MVFRKIKTAKNIKWRVKYSQHKFEIAKMALKNLNWKLLLDLNGFQNSQKPLKELEKAEMAFE